MTVSYSYQVANGTGFGNFWKTLFRWKGSIYKLILPDMILYVLIYYGIYMTDYFWLRKYPEDHIYRRRFELVVQYCESVAHFIPLQFLLAFYVAQIVSRWWDQYMNCPWPDSVACLTAFSLHGHDERGRLMRRTLVRYVNLAIVFTFITVSSQAKKRFPTLEHLVAAGFLLPHEKKVLEEIQEKEGGPKYYVPIVWATGVVSNARKEGKIRDDMSMFMLMKFLCMVRMYCGNLISYDWISFPLVYTQVVTLAVYIYFIAYVIGGQTDFNNDKMYIYFPLFHFLEFFFMMGWLKVAEILINPFGEDEDDFEVNWLIDRNLKISYLMVDEMNSSFPILTRDMFWDEVVPNDLFYTKNALKFKTEGYVGSAIIEEMKEMGRPKEVVHESIHELDGGKVIVHRVHQGLLEVASSLMSNLHEAPMYENARLQKYQSAEDLAGGDQPQFE